MQIINSWKITEARSSYAALPLEIQDTLEPLGVSSINFFVADGLPFITISVGSSLASAPRLITPRLAIQAAKALQGLLGQKLLFRSLKQDSIELVAEDSAWLGRYKSAADYGCALEDIARAWGPW